MPGLSITPGLSLGQGLSFGSGLSPAGGLSPTSGVVIFQGLGSLSAATRQTMQVTFTLPGAGGLSYPGSIAFQTNPASVPGAGGLQLSGTMGLKATVGFSGSGGAGS